MKRNRTVKDAAKVLDANEIWWNNGIDLLREMKREHTEEVIEALHVTYRHLMGR